MVRVCAIRPVTRSLVAHAAVQGLYPERLSLSYTSRAHSDKGGSMPRVLVIWSSWKAKISIISAGSFLNPRRARPGKTAIS